MFNFKNQFLLSISEYLDENITDRKEIEKRTFNAIDMELFARQYYEDMVNDDVKKDSRVLKIFYFAIGFIVAIGILVFALNNGNS